MQAAQLLFGNAIKIHGRSGNLPLSPGALAAAIWNYMRTRVRHSNYNIYLLIHILIYLNLFRFMP